MAAAGTQPKRVWPLIAAGVIIVAALAAVAFGVLMAGSESSRSTGAPAPPVAPASAAPTPAAPAATPSPPPVAPSPTVPPTPTSMPPTPTPTPSVAAVEPVALLIPMNAPLNAVSQLEDFTAPFGLDVAIAAAPVTTASVPGDEPGWYGGTKGQKELTCDRSRLADTLEADPDLARVWGQFGGLLAGDVREYVMRLTPVVLRSDTAVSISGLDEDAGFPAVLQAGTAVLVNEFGEPVVRCFGNNPLSPSGVVIDSSTPVGGTDWPGWNPDQIVTIAPVFDPFDAFILVDTPTGRLFVRPLGIHGTQDRWLRS